MSVLFFRDHLINYVIPHHLGEADPSTIEELKTSVSYWEQATNNASVQDYKAALPLFQEFLKTKTSRRTKGLLAPATKRKHIQNIQYLLDRAGPATRQCDGAGVIDTPVKIMMPKGGASLAKRPFTLLELSRILAACEFIAWERRRRPLPARAFWRCFILFGYNTGLRIETLLKLRWEWLVKDDDGRTWFEIPESAMKMRAFRCYVSPAALAAIEPLRVMHTETQPLVFCFPFGYNHARAVFTKLLQIAQVPLRGLTANKFHALRRTCNDELAKLNVFAAKLQLGHATRDVTLQHYTSPAVLVETHTKMPQPPWTADVLTPPAA